MLWPNRHIASISSAAVGLSDATYLNAAIISALSGRELSSLVNRRGCRSLQMRTRSCSADLPKSTSLRSRKREVGFANGSFAIRQSKWKLELCPDSGGWSFPRPGVDDVSQLPPIQLYDLASDVGEKKNVEAEHPEVVHQLTRLLKKYVALGRSTPGTLQRNTGEVDIWKTGKLGRRQSTESYIHPDAGGT